jgi:catechol 2,3-dioxygenase-like lactoylglutathione lyase family enzyme
MVVVMLVGCLAMCFLIAGAAQTNDTQKAFSRSTIDIGVVVSDVAKAAKFYTEAVGFTELQGFDVSADLAGDSGLTNHLPFKVRVFVLVNEATATRLKLMEVPGPGSAKVDNQYINSSLGFSYLTVHVADMKRAVGRAEGAGVQPVTDPYKLGGNNYLTLLKDPDGNIIELIGPMK